MAKMSVRKSGRRAELAFQGKIIDGYGRDGGRARKWATHMQVGVPDLVAALPGVGAHMAEVKHRPLWAVGVDHPNPLDAIQIKRAREYIDAGALVVGMAVIGSAEARQSVLVVFDPLSDAVVWESSVPTPWVPGRGYAVRCAVEKYVERANGLRIGVHGANLRAQETS